MIKKLIATSTVIFSSTVTTAAFVDHGTYITDTETGYDWLKLTETNTLSYNQVLSSGLLSEWNYVGDVSGLSLYDFTESQIPSFLDLYGDLQYPEINDWAQSYAITGYTEFGGIDWQLDRVRIEADLNPSNPEIQIVDATLLFADLDAIHPWTGHALVRVSEVPVPAALWLFTSALITTFGLKRKLS